MGGAALAISIISLLLTSVGWFVNSWLNARTQKGALINSLTNDARIKLTDAIRNFHAWCASINASVGGMPADDITSFGRTIEHHDRRIRELLELTSNSRTLDWLQRMEEYEPLFPGTAAIRIELLHKVGAACDSARKLAELHTPGSPPPQIDRDRFQAEIYDLVALSWDLLVFIQNESIGRITGNKIPQREPPDPTAVRLIADDRGCLVIKRPKLERA